MNILSDPSDNNQAALIQNESEGNSVSNRGEHKRINLSNRDTLNNTIRLPSLKGTEIETVLPALKESKVQEEDDRYEIIKVQESKESVIILFLDFKIIQEKLLLQDAIVIILAVSLSGLPNLIPPMLFGPI